MDYPVIAKPGLDDFSVRPNLDRYDALRESFSWQELRGRARRPARRRPEPCARGHRPARRPPRRQGGHVLGGRRRRGGAVHLRPDARPHEPLCQRAARPRHREGRPGVHLHGARAGAVRGLLRHPEGWCHSRPAVLGVRTGPGEGPAGGQRREGACGHAGAARPHRAHSRRPAGPQARHRRQQERPLTGAAGARRHQLRGGDGVSVFRIRHRTYHGGRLLHHALHLRHHGQAEGRGARPPGLAAAHGDRKVGA